LKTTFASRHSRTVSLAEALAPEAVAVVAQHATGAQRRIDPSRG
jgi:NADPH2:quinone reductase